MQIEFRHSDELMSTVRDQMRRRTLFVLGRFQSLISRIVFSVLPRTAEAQETMCRLEVHLFRGQPILLEEAGEDLESIFEHAIDRAGRTIARRCRDEREPTTRSEPPIPQPR